MSLIRLQSEISCQITYKVVSDVKFANEAGTVPLSWLTLKYSDLSLDSWPSDSGIVPVSGLLYK
jgi:hypothetical protein